MRTYLLGLLGVVLTLSIAACGGPDMAATATRTDELRQIATLTAPTPTVYRPPTLPPPTPGPIQLTAQVVQQQGQGTQAAIRDAACREVAKVYAENGQPFDPSAVARNPAQTLAEVQVMIGIGDPAKRRTLTGETRNAAYTKYVYACAGR